MSGYPKGLVVAGVLSLLALIGCTSSKNGVGTGTGSTTAPTTPPTTPATTLSNPATSSSAPPASSSSTVSTRPASWCVDGEITVAAASDPGGAAAGHNDVILTFTNSSTRTCVLYGYPGADALDSGGHVVAHATRSLTGYIGGTYSGVHNVTLHPGQVASTVLEGNVGSGSATCSSAVSLAVTPPNLFHSSLLHGAPYACGFVIHPVVAGSSGR